jgi:hypothetical protein
LRGAAVSDDTPSFRQPPRGIVLHRKRYFIYAFLFAFLSIYSLDRVTMAAAPREERAT